MPVQPNTVNANVFNRWPGAFPMTLIIVTCDSAAGNLKFERRAQRVIAITHRLVTGPVSAGPPETFFRRRRAVRDAGGLLDAGSMFDVDGDELGGQHLEAPRQSRIRVWSEIPEICLEHDRIELWIDPDPNAQLLLVQLLDWLGRIPDITPRLWLKQSESPLGARRPFTWTYSPRLVEDADIALATRAWVAFCAPTPEAWSALRHDPDLDRLPGLFQAVMKMLNELPDRTGLGATARHILHLANNCYPKKLRSAAAIAHRRLSVGERFPLNSTEVEAVMGDLAFAPMPALSGVTERMGGMEMVSVPVSPGASERRFVLDVWQDDDRRRRYAEAEVEQTEFGRRLEIQEDDWARHNPIHRWWGGSLLTNDALWRWDAVGGKVTRD